MLALSLFSCLPFLLLNFIIFYIFKKLCNYIFSTSDNFNDNLA